mmetsp:Transcript_11489/g.29411  ORF Transcript_11489/g.29411 Transcript_11489/m.29411 type:complete len:258 (-) Transcript_11489:1066-1839(-)
MSRNRLRPTVSSYAFLISILWPRDLPVRICTMGFLRVPSPFMALRRPWASSAALKACAGCSEPSAPSLTRISVPPKCAAPPSLPCSKYFCSSAVILRCLASRCSLERLETQPFSALYAPTLFSCISFENALSGLVRPRHSFGSAHGWRYRASKSTATPGPPEPAYVAETDPAAALVFCSPLILSMLPENLTPSPGRAVLMTPTSKAASNISFSPPSSMREITLLEGSLYSLRYFWAKLSASFLSLTLALRPTHTITS